VRPAAASRPPRLPKLFLLGTCTLFPSCDPPPSCDGPTRGAADDGSLKAWKGLNPGGGRRQGKRSSGTSPSAIPGRVAGADCGRLRHRPTASGGCEALSLRHRPTASDGCEALSRGRKRWAGTCTRQFIRSSTSSRTALANAVRGRLRWRQCERSSWSWTRWCF
jgi:hypothetical protein